MKLNYSVQFDKPSAEVLENFCKPEFYAQHQALLGGRNFEVVEQEDDGTTARVKFRYEVASDVPAFAKKILGDTSDVVQEETWNRATGKGLVTVDVATLPGTLVCNAMVTDSGAGSSKSYDWEIKVKIPLVGGKIEKVVADDIQSKSIPDQNAVNQILNGG